VEAHLVVGEAAFVALLNREEVPAAEALEENTAEVSAAAGHIDVMSGLQGNFRCFQQDDCFQVVVGSR